MALAPAARLLDLEVGDGGPDALGGADDRPRVRVEQPGIPVAGRAGRGGLAAFVEQELGDRAHRIVSRGNA